MQQTEDIERRAHSALLAPCINAYIKSNGFFFREKKNIKTHRALMYICTHNIQTCIYSYSYTCTCSACVSLSMEVHVSVCVCVWVCCGYTFANILTHTLMSIYAHAVANEYIKTHIH